MFFLWVVLSVTAAAADWPQFRGPSGAGVADGKPLPVKFGPADSAWKTKVPFGQSSPIVAGGKVFVTASEGKALLTIGYDAATGREVWRRELPRQHVHEIYKANDPASSTAASDGSAVYVFFPDFGMASYGLDGKERWRLPLGPFQNFYGISTSPVVAGNLVVLLCDETRGGFLMAVDKNTGKQRWRTARKEHKEGWGVPLVHGDQVITIGSTRLDSYYLATGELKWWLPISSSGGMGTPVVNGDRVLVSTLGSNEPWLPTFAAVLEKTDKNKDGKVSAAESKTEKDWEEHFGWVDRNGDGQIDAAEWEEARTLGMGPYGAISVRMNGKGKLEAESVDWRLQKNIPYIPAPLLYGGVYYLVKSGGIVTALDPATGKVLKQGRSAEALGEYYASPVAGDGKVYMVSEEGKLSVLKAGAEWEVLAVNDLGEQVFASPAIGDGRLFVRTRGTLYCFSGK